MKRIFYVLIFAVSVPAFVFAAPPTVPQDITLEPSYIEAMKKAQAATPVPPAETPEQFQQKTQEIIARALALEARIAAAEAARLQSAVIVDPAAKDFAKLPSVVRLRLKDKLGTAFGTGSVIVSKKGQAVILTVGHIFRNADEKSVVMVDIFNPTTGKVETFTVGYKDIMNFDLEDDVGLLKIPSERIIPTLPLGSPDDVLEPGQRVVSYGCGGGEPPTALLHRITLLNRYLSPSQNIECTGVPLQGRSGGALVDEYGRLIGVTIAADNRDQRGLYSGLQPIRALLTKAGIDPADLEKPIPQK